jgi:thiamine biosynthesis lipoprotein
VKFLLAVVLVMLSVPSGGQTTPVAPVPPMAPSVAPPASADQSREVQHLKAQLADFANMHRYHEANAALAPAAPGEQRVVFMGDSLTDDWGRGDSVFFPGKSYINRGISGQTTPQMLLRFQQDVVALHPVAVVLLGGTNDVAGNTGPESIEMIEDNIRSMAEISAANGIKMILCAELPALQYPWSKAIVPAPILLELSAWEKQYAAAHGLAYVDYYSALVGPDGGYKPGLSKEGVHPTAEGYAVMTPVAEKVIEQVLSEAPMPSGSGAVHDMHRPALPGTPKSETGPAPLERYNGTHRAMGTVFALDLYTKDQSSADGLMQMAFDEVDRLDDLLSNYRASSELSRINHEARLGAVTTDPETFGFLARASYWSSCSDGAFDITVGPLLRKWGFFFHGGRVPSAAELTALRSSVGWRNVVLDARLRSVRFADGRAVELDPGSIGKGFAVDSVVSLLRQQGVTSALLSAGGSTLYAIGNPPGKAGWRVDVPDPARPGTIASTVLLKDSSLSTGACTEKFFIKDGHLYCHIFDPRTMRPVEGVLQSTVIDPSATDSDALSTVVFVLGADSSRKLMKSIPEAEALVFRKPAAGPACLAMNWQDDVCAAQQRRQGTNNLGASSL